VDEPFLFTKVPIAIIVPGIKQICDLQPSVVEQFLKLLAQPTCVPRWLFRTHARWGDGELLCGHDLGSVVHARPLQPPIKRIKCDNPPVKFVEGSKDFFGDFAPALKAKDVVEAYNKFLPADSLIVRRVDYIKDFRKLDSVRVQERTKIGSCAFDIFTRKAPAARVDVWWSMSAAPAP
jgi:hypothetical protein